MELQNDFFFSGRFCLILCYRIWLCSFFVLFVSTVQILHCRFFFFLALFGITKSRFKFFFTAVFLFVSYLLHFSFCFIHILKQFFVSVKYLCLSFLYCSLKFTYLVQISQIFPFSILQ